MHQHRLASELRPVLRAVTKEVRVGRGGAVSPPPAHHVGVDNRLLETLPSRDLRSVLSACEPIVFAPADVIHHQNERIRWVYFPTGTVISMVVSVAGVAAVEVGLVGNEGMLGTSVALGIDYSDVRAVVQGGGSALRMTARHFRGELERSAAMQRVIDRYVCVQLAQLAQTVACTRFHVVERRLARWLLMTQDRAHSDAFQITHEFLARMLGVRRVGVTKAAGALQKRRLIHYIRGSITVLDRRGLQAAACGCYDADLETYDRILG